MEFGLSEEQHLLVDSLKSLCADSMSLDQVRACTEDPKAGLEIHQRLVELGMSGVMAPAALAGSELTLLDAALIAEVLGYYMVPERISGAVLASIALKDRNQDDDLRAITTGEISVGFGFTEYIGSREGAGLSLNAQDQLSGKTLFVRAEEAMDRALLCTPQGDVLWIQDSNALNCQPLVTVDKTRRFVELSCKNQAVVVLARAGDTLINTLISASRTLTAADTLGAASAMLDQAVAYALERKQFNRLIGSFQAVKHLCAEMAAQLEPARSLLWYTAHAHEAVPADFHLSTCHLKALMDDIGRFVARTATEVHGGMGFTDLMGLHFWFKRIGVNRQWLGGPEQVRTEAARHANYISSHSPTVAGRG